ncbi:MAG: glycogen debranching protein GlgX [Lachnospiraceae bacterium]|jgi:glycogen operon protein|nr:glycogen debranching protein GlgX [uncultured Schaedlerella sp.]MCI9015452.1 glycogen debranching protein GlgX [Lachnospiraceae bacterium]
METKGLLEAPISRIHMEPMDVINGFEVRPGMYEVNGATAIPCGVNFTVYSYGATSCELLLFKRMEAEPYAVLKFPENYKIGKVYSMIVFGLNVHDFEYAYRMDGPYDPKEGLLFNKNNTLLDIYAKAVAGQRLWGIPQMEGDVYRARVVKDDFDWKDSGQPLIPMEDLIIYEMHVRGFTKHDSSGVAHPGTFAGLREKIPYLKELGINAVELMPIFEFDEMRDYRVVDNKPVMNYWGYNTVCFFAPNTSYTAKVEYNKEGTELKELISALHENGIECILDVVFNHTAEGDERGPCFSFKGFDNNIYYMLTPDGNYYNFSGCGNTLNCNHPIVHQMILECLRYWTTAYHVDGFRFDLATILGRNEDGSPMSKPPLLQSLAFDPILGNVKLIAEAWDAGGLYQVGSFPSWSRWAEWNGRYRDDMRNFLKGDFGMWEVAARRITGSQDIYNPEWRGNNASVNFLTCHDGFTLWDLYSYNEKHNEANGWGNTDGCDDNRSWNCGAEGDTADEGILTLRRRLAMNAFAVLMCSRGTPMFFSGDEFLNSQFGNNNAYCQDNEISWLDWKDLEKNRAHFEFCKYMAAFRKAHPVLRKFAGNSWCGFPEIQVMGADAETKVLRVIYAGRIEVDDRGNGHDDIVCLAVNVFWEDQEFWLPSLQGGKVWYVAADTSGRYLPHYIPGQQGMNRLPENKVTVGARSVCIFVA